MCAAPGFVDTELVREDGDRHGRAEAQDHLRAVKFTVKLASDLRGLPLTPCVTGYQGRSRQLYNS